MKSCWLLCVVAMASVGGPLNGDDWPQWRGPRRDGVWREDGIIETLPAALRVKWRQSIGEGYAGPSVADGRVYVADRLRYKGVEDPENQFSRSPLRGAERVLCLNEQSGDILWKVEYPCVYAVSYPAGPRATPTVDNGKVYALGTMGNFFCLDARTGEILWTKNFVRDFGTEINTWGMSAAPLIDGHKVILLTGGANSSAVVALDKENGDPIWKALEAADPGYSAPEIFEVGGTRQLIVWTPQALYSLHLETGAVLWQQAFELRSGLSVASPVLDDKTNRLFVSAFYNGPLMMQLEPKRPAAELLWKGTSDSERKTDGLHALMCTPILKEGHIYGICSYGQLRCLEASTGKRLWETLEATGNGRWWNAFLIEHEDRTFICNEQGELIIAKLSPEGYTELSRAPLIEPTRPVQRRTTVWSHPAFANRSIYARNDKEIVCVDMAAPASSQ